LNNISVVSYWWSRQEKHRDSHPPTKLLPGDTENAIYLRHVTSKIIIRIFLPQFTDKTITGIPRESHLPATSH